MHLSLNPEAPRRPPDSEPRACHNKTRSRVGSSAERISAQLGMRGMTTSGGDPRVLGRRNAPTAVPEGDRGTRHSRSEDDKESGRGAIEFVIQKQALLCLRLQFSLHSMWCCLRKTWWTESLTLSFLPPSPPPSFPSFVAFFFFFDFFFNGDGDVSARRSQHLELC